MSNDPKAVVRRVGGQLVLDDPDAVAVMRAVAKANCVATKDINNDRIGHFKQRLTDRNLNASEWVIVVVNADDPNGCVLAEALMPGHDWQPIRDAGLVPFGRGLASREFIQETLGILDEEAAQKLQGMTEVAVVVVDHGVAEVFAA